MSMMSHRAAAFIGGLLWNVTPALPFWMAGVIAIAGVVVCAASTPPPADLKLHPAATFGTRV